MSSRLITIIIIIISIPIVGFILKLLFYFGIRIGSFIRLALS